MATTVALLEFFVIGSAWISLLVIVLAVIPELGFKALFSFSFWKPDVSTILWIVLPGTYALGIITQSITWRLWYMPHSHRPDLSREISGNRKDHYNSVYRTMKRKGFSFLGLSDDIEILEQGSQLGVFLDALRWEIFAHVHQELAKQYLLQFHLYRISYGILPPILLSVFIFAGIGVAILFQGSPNGLAFLFIGGAFASLMLVFAAKNSAMHRRRRTWKYLINSMNAILNSEFR